MTDRTQQSASAPESGAETPSAGGPQSPGASAKDSALLHFLLNTAMLAVFMFLFVAAGDLPDSAWEPLGSGAFPRIILGTLMVLNLAMLAQTLPKALAELHSHGTIIPAIVTDTLKQRRLVVFMLGLFGIYVFAVGLAGYAIATFVFVIAAQLGVGPKTVKNAVTALIIALVASFGLQYFFATVLSVFLPSGPFL